MGTRARSHFSLSLIHLPLSIYFPLSSPPSSFLYTLRARRFGVPFLPAHAALALRALRCRRIGTLPLPRRRGAAATTAAPPWAARGVVPLSAAFEASAATAAAAHAAAASPSHATAAHATAALLRSSSSSPLRIRAARSVVASLAALEARVASSATAAGAVAAATAAEGTAAAISTRLTRLRARRGKVSDLIAVVARRARLPTASSTTATTATTTTVACAVTPLEEVAPRVIASTFRAAPERATWIRCTA